MVNEMWRVLARGGLFFTRLVSNIGFEDVDRSRRTTVRLPDGTDRFVVDEPMLVRSPVDSAGVSSIPSRRRTFRVSAA